MNKITPFGNNILVKPHENQTILKSSEGSLCEYGEIIALSTELLNANSNCELKVGDIIGYTIWGVNRLEIENEKYYFIPYDSRFILGVIVS